jgi:GH15 family glucan-1,4-alpha-glucosidase
VTGRIEDYAIVGDMQSAALIGTDGSVHWLCLPRFDAVELFERLLALRNDVGLLSEEYDPRYGRLVGNMPQAFSHVPLVQTALNLAGHAEEHRRGVAGDTRRSVPG